MNKRSSAMWIGGFVVGAVTLAVIGLIVFGSGRYFKTTLKYVSYFEGDVKGLNPGAQVNFRGVQIGQVTDILITVDVNGGDIRIPVYFEIDPSQVNKSGQGIQAMEAEQYVDLLIDKGLKAQLSVKSFLTGQLSIELDFYPDEPLRLAGTDGEVTEIPTVPSRLEMITQSLQEIPFKEISARLLSVAEGLDTLIHSPEAGEGVVSFNQLMRNANRMVTRLEAQLETMSTSFNATMSETRLLVRNVDRELVPRGAGALDRAHEALVRAEDTLEATGELVATLDTRISPLLGELERTAQSARAGLERAGQTLKSMDDFVSEDSEVRYRLIQALEELAQAARSVRFMAEYLERNPQSLIQGKTQPGGR